MTTIEITLIVAVIFLALLVLYAIRLIVTTCRACAKTTHTIEAVKRQLDDLGHEPKNLLRHVNEITADIRNKMKLINPLFLALHNIGKTCEEKTARHHSSVCPCCKSRHAMHEMGEEDSSTSQCLLQLALIGAKMWQEYQQHDKERR